MTKTTSPTFSISSRGVLSFKLSPDYEMPRGMAIVTANTNTYRVVVVASDDALGAEGMMGYKKVTVTVTNLDEPGEITCLEPAAPGGPAVDRNP